MPCPFFPMHRLHPGLICLLMLATSALGDINPIVAPMSPPTQYKLLREIPRPTNHFTQGLVFVGDTLLESTGGFGRSGVFSYQGADFVPTLHRDLPRNRFGEGIVFLNNKLYQLTWSGGEVFVYSLDLRPQKSLFIEGEGWGLTTDGHALISSNGSDTLVFRAIDNARPLHQITIIDKNGHHWRNINELEWVNGWILANVWHSNTVLVINPQTGAVVNTLDFSALANKIPKKTPEQVLNGLAWNATTQTLLLTGKEWPLWFEVKLLSAQ